MGTLTANLPDELRGLGRWVCADGSSKRPFTCFDGKPASVSDPRTWGTFEEASESVELGRFPWAGFVFAGDGLVGIDIDCGFDEIGLPTDEAMEAIEACGSYTEVSRSGKGFHIICKGELPFKGANNREGWEIYSDARYFVLTGQTVAHTEIVEAQSAIDAILAKHFKSEIKSKTTESRSDLIWRPEWRRVENGVVPLAPDYPVVSSGSRHLSLVSFCGQAHSQGAPKEAVLMLAHRANERWLKPPLPADEVEQVVDSVTRYRR